MKAMNGVFSDLRQLGYLARQNFSCCSGCAGSGLSTIAAKRAAAGKSVRGAVYFHRQDNEHAVKNGELYLRFGPLHHSPGDSISEQVIEIGKAEVGCELVAVLRARGFEPTWSGDPNECVVVAV